MRGPKQLNRVLHLTFNMGIGGTEQVIRQLIMEMSEHNIFSEIICIDGYVGSIGLELQDQGVVVQSIKRARGFDWRLVFSIRKIIQEGKFDIVHCHQYTPYLYGFLSALSTGAKVVFTEHGRFYPDRYRYKAMLVNAIISRMTPAVVAISESTKNALSCYEFIPKDKIEIIYNGIKDLVCSKEKVLSVKSELGIPEDGFIVGTVSRLDPVKNQVMMLRAFQAFHNVHKDSWLLMVGDGPDRKMLEELAQSLNLSDRIIFTGFIDNPVNYLAAMNLFLLSSHTEGTSMTLLEAMSLGVPAVVTDVGGNPEIVKHGETGYITPTDDAMLFSDAMIKLRDNAEHLKLFGAQGRYRFLNGFSSASMSNNYISLYNRCL